MASKKEKMEVADTYEHIRNRGMWNDSKAAKKLSDILYKDGKWAYQQIYMSPALIKAIDELITNMVDRYIKNKKAGFVISADFNKDTGEMVFKNSTGFAIHMIPEHNIWSVHAAFLNLMSSTNFKSKKRVTGGLNGIGLKTVAAFSEYVKVCTSDGQQQYTQEFTGRKQTKDQAEPTVKKWTRVAQTTIKFMPDYKLFSLEEDGKLSPEIIETIDRVIETRMRFASVYTGIQVKYNGIKIKETYDSLIENLSGTEPKPFKTTVKPKVAEADDIVYKDWIVGFCVSDTSAGVISIVNGIYSKGGDHIDHLFKQILKHIKDKASKIAYLKNQNITPSMIKDKITMVMMGEIPNIDFSAQNKSSAVIEDKSILKNYELTVLVKNKIWKFIEPYLASQYASTTVKDLNKKTKLNLGKDYKEAAKSNTKESLKCTLFLPEGLSAASPIRTGIHSRPDKEYFGYLIMGVVPTIRKDSRQVKDTIIYGKKIIDNKKLKAFRQVMGLTVGKTYKTEKELKELNYGTIVIATDQDTDGLGNICPHFLDYIYATWPELIRQGRVKRLSTPLVIAKHKRTKKEKIFYLERHFEDWVKTINPNDYEQPFEYYKGLGTNEKMMPIIFKNLEKNLYTFADDKDAEQTFESYYGKNANERKEILQIPIVYPDYEDYPSYGEVKCSEFVKLEGKIFYHEEKIFRASLHIFDGLMPSRRKAFAAARRRFANSSKKLKVINLAGTIIDKWGYHHGDASINGAIVSLTNCYPGSSLCPLLVSDSSIGGRILGSAGAASARYMNIEYNKVCDLLFPREDDALLEKCYVDGEKCEPTHYVPILPYALMQYYKTPSVGWKQDLVARDLDDLKTAIFNTLDGKPFRHLRPCVRLFNLADMSEIADKASFTGTYVKTPTGYIITELPPTVQSSKIETMLDMNDDIDHVYDDTGKYNKVEIKVETKVQFDDTPEGKAAAVKFLGIHKSITSFINYPDDTHVLTFDTYKQAFNHWFPERKNLYRRRFKRQSIIIKLKIQMLENIVRYVDKFVALGLVNKKAHIVYGILEKNKFDKMNITPLVSQTEIHEDKLEEVVFGEDASYTYLDLKDSQKFKETNVKRLEQLAKLREEYDRLTADPDKLIIDTWKDDVTKVCKLIDAGAKDRWGHSSDNTSASDVKKERQNVKAKSGATTKAAKTKAARAK